MDVGSISELLGLEGMPLMVAKMLSNTIIGGSAASIDLNWQLPPLFP